MKKFLGFLYIVTIGGAEGIRTPDLLLAKQALSRLSYSPTVDLLYQILWGSKRFAFSSLEISCYTKKGICRCRVYPS
jgi:hypothetical protein